LTKPSPDTGRRKEAVARVRLRPYRTITINSRAFDNYFTSATHADGDGAAASIDAQQTTTLMPHRRRRVAASRSAAPSISRSLLEIDETVRPALKKAGLLTRDSRRRDQEVRSQKGAKALSTPSVNGHAVRFARTASRTRERRDHHGTRVPTRSSRRQCLFSPDLCRYDTRKVHLRWRRVLAGLADGGRVASTLATSDPASRSSLNNAVVRV